MLLLYPIAVVLLELLAHKKVRSISRVRHEENSSRSIGQHRFSGTSSISCLLLCPLRQDLRIHWVLMHSDTLRAKGTPQTIHRITGLWLTNLNMLLLRNPLSALNMIFWWDTKRAFDSVSFNLQKLLWARLRVPVDVVK
jgi:hypothetical protein